MHSAKASASPDSPGSRPLALEDELDPLARMLRADPRRSDARRNGERIIAAALEVLAERGFDAGIPEIAARAGVGKATVYRMFPTKAALCSAVAAHRYVNLLRRLEGERDDPDPARALRRVVRTLFAARGTDRVVLDALRGPATPEIEAATSRIAGLLGDLLVQAQAAGTLRDDVTVADVRVMIGGIAGQLSAAAEPDPAVWERFGDLVVDSLRPVRPGS